MPKRRSLGLPPALTLRKKSCTRTTGDGSIFVQITYPGTGNYTTLSYDGLGRNVSIIETTSGSVTSTKQFVWCGLDRCEQRNASSSVTAQFFALGETISGTSYFYDVDHLGLTAASVRPFDYLRMIGWMGYPSWTDQATPRVTMNDLFPQGLGAHPLSFNPLAHSGSIREMTNSAGAIQAEYSYDPFGRVTQLQGTLSADFQYAGYYEHGPSGLNLTLFRAYSPTLGRWINRDPIEEYGGINLYTYVDNDPLGGIDLFGLTGKKLMPPDSGFPPGTVDNGDGTYTLPNGHTYRYGVPNNVPCSREGVGGDGGGCHPSGNPNACPHHQK